MRLLFALCGLLSLLILTACVGDDDDGIDFDKQYKEIKAQEVARSFESGEIEDIEKYVSANVFLQHDLTLAEGRQGLIDAVKLAQVQKHDINLDFWRSFTDEDFVVLHIDYTWEKQHFVGFEVFRFEDDLIVEHWINRQTKETKSVSGWSMVNGVARDDDKENTANNKALVTRFTNEVLINRQTDNAATFFYKDNLVQHNPSVDNNVTAFIEALQADKLGRYDTLHRVLGEHNFVLTMSEGEKNGEPTAFFDLYRFYDGKIVEHWDVIEAIPPREAWKNGNGKFHL